ncbi:MAG: peptidoglycan-associated lipoprotein Pal [candidate division NC10 bacterium]|nr:peptidoglycan-associated lipoprotein Pal [candidate division NC10 bacterium]
MNSNRPIGGSHRRSPRTVAEIRAILFLGIGFLLLLSACAKRPEVVSTGPPPTAAGQFAQQPAGQPLAHPGLGPTVGGPGAASKPGSASPDGPEGGPTAGQPAEQGATAAVGSGPTIPLPPGTEAIILPPSPPREQPVAQVAQVTSKQPPLKDIFFDFDKAEIRPDAKGLLTEDIAWLKAHAKAVITIEGHCDERGTSEYNLGLGERRAKATKDYLVASGIDGKRLATVSYGKERPFVLGHDESAWKWNRKAHFVVTRE